MKFFSGLSFYVLPLGFGSKRMEFFEKQIQKSGGTLSGRKMTHVVVEDSVSEEKQNCMSALKKKGLALDENVKYVKVSWVSKCLSAKGLVDEKPFEVTWAKVDEDERLEKRKLMMDEEKDELPEKSQKIEEKYICSKPSSSSQVGISQTKKLIISELEKLANAYSLQKDAWRSHGYKKAINAILLYDKDISTFQEARNIPGVGDKMALKIMEILESGKLKKVDEILDDKTRILDLFCRIWGVGPSTAEGWYIQGFRTLQDLKDKAKLTKQQQIGLKLYDDLQKRMSRKEVEDIARIIEKEVVKVHESLSSEVVGSYRRGKETCGDVDIMIVNSEIKTPLEILIQVTESLRNLGYLTDDLLTLEDLEESEQKKYFGIFKFPGENQIHRRLDLFVVPKSEYAAGLMHYTGSAMFNRSIKLLAAKKQMTLSEHGLYVGTVRKGSEVMFKGDLVPTPTEEDIFKGLGLPYRHPEERDH